MKKKGKYILIDTGNGWSYDINTTQKTLHWWLDHLSQKRWFSNYDVYKFSKLWNQ